MRFCLLFILSVPFFAGANVAHGDSVQRMIADQVVLFPQEKLYVQTDRSTFVAGETLWFRAFLVDAALHVPSFRSAYVDIELIDPTDSVVIRVRVKRDTGDAYSGSLMLPANLATGNYILRAYTNHMRELGEEYFFHRTLEILHPHVKAADERMASSASEYALFFYPEGGYVIEGVPSRIAFKALHPDGTPAHVQGRLMDDSGKDLGPVVSVHQGMGDFGLTAQPSSSYYVVVEDQIGEPRRFKVPAARHDTYGLQVETVDGELGVSVLHPPGATIPTTLRLILHTRGIVHYSAEWDSSFSTLLFDTSGFPSGVVQILLLDEHANPLSERLYFCRNKDDANVHFELDRDSYGFRSPVKARVRLTDQLGAVAKGSFAISVTEDADVSPDKRVDIFSSLLLDSELKGYITDPAFYFQEENARALDLLMMTHGWRRYNIPEVLKGHYTRPAISAIENGMEIRGTVRNSARGKVAPGRKVSLVSWSTGYSEETVTDTLGQFVFDGIEFPDSLTFIVQTDPYKGWNNPAVEIAHETFPPMAKGMFRHARNATVAGQNDPVQERVIEKAALYNRLRHGMKSIEIEEVTITGKSRPTAQDKNFSFYMPINDRVNTLTAEKLEEIQAISVSDALKHLPFLTVMEDENNMRKVYIDRMRLNSMQSVGALGLPAALIVDDMIIHNYDIDNVLDPSSIEKIGVLKGTAAAILGGDGTGGAIVITTKKGITRTNSSNLSKNHIRVVTPLGYHLPAEFYSPVYETKAQRENPGPDLRTTIYWNPNVNITSSDPAEISFYTADGNSSYSVVIEGVTDQGFLFRLQTKIAKD